MPTPHHLKYRCSCPNTWKRFLRILHFDFSLKLLFVLLKIVNLWSVNRCFCIIKQFSDVRFLLRPILKGNLLGQKFQPKIYLINVTLSTSFFFSLKGEMNPPQPREIIELSPGKWKTNKQTKQSKQKYELIKNENRLTQRSYSAIARNLKVIIIN